MIKLKNILKESILISRRSSEERLKYHRAYIYKKIRKYIKNGCKGSLNLHRAPIEYLPKELKRVGGDFYIMNSLIRNISNIRHINGNLIADYSFIEEYPSNMLVKDTVSLTGTNITSLPDNLTIGGDLYVNSTNFSEIPSNLNIKYRIICDYTPLAKKYTKEQIKQLIISKGGSVSRVE